MADLLLTKLLGNRRKAHQCINLTVSQELHRLGRGVDDEIDVSLGVYADVGCHGRKEDMVWRTQLGHGDGFALEVTNRVDALGPEQLEASRMYPAEEDERQAGVDRNDEWRNEGHADVDRAGGEAGIYVHRHLDILDAGETLAPQQLFGNVLRRNADARDFRKAQRARFRRLLLG